MKAFKVYRKDDPARLVLVYAKNYNDARAVAVSHHWAWQPKDYPDLVTELAPRWDTTYPPNRFCIYHDDLAPGLPPWGELTVKVDVEAPAKEKAWKVYHQECKEEVLLVYADDMHQATRVALYDNPFDWRPADHALLRAMRVPGWDHESPPERRVATNAEIHRDLPDFFSNIDCDGVAEHYVKRSNEVTK